MSSLGTRVKGVLPAGAGRRQGVWKSCRETGVASITRTQKPADHSFKTAWTERILDFPIGSLSVFCLWALLAS